jgi:hemoglobin
MIDKLYETIGGNSTIQAATESFYRRILQDETLRQFFTETDMSRLKSGQSMFLSMLLGGRAVYTGKELDAAHSKLTGLNDQHFDTFIAHFRAALDEVGVKRENAEQVVQLLEAKREKIVQRSSAAGK